MNKKKKKEKTYWAVFKKSGTLAFWDSDRNCEAVMSKIKSTASGYCLDDEGEYVAKVKLVEVKQ